MRRFLGLLLVFLSWCSIAGAHNIPESHLDLRISGDQIILTLDSPVSGWMYDIPILTPETAVARQTEIESLVLSRLSLTAGNEKLSIVTAGPAQLMPRKRNETPLRLFFATTLPATAKRLTVRGSLFPSDPKHRIILTVHGADGQLLHEAILTPQAPESVVTIGIANLQNPLAVFAQFVKEGIYHIAIGPDHILFVIALLLMGGRLAQLLKVVTAFTIAHSITLILAASGIVRIPSSIVEPTIAASIVFVGVRVLQNKWRKSDGNAPPATEERLPYAFGFGLVHGFGFASALSELELPRQALAMSLFGFNIGVEIGQAALVLLVAPLLMWLHRRYPALAHRFILAVAILVITAGAYWFGERIAG